MFAGMCEICKVNLQSTQYVPAIEAYRPISCPTPNISPARDPLHIASLDFHRPRLLFHIVRNVIFGKVHESRKVETGAATTFSKVGSYSNSWTVESGDKAKAQIQPQVATCTS